MAGPAEPRNVELIGGRGVGDLQREFLPRSISRLDRHIRMAQDRSSIFAGLVAVS